MAPIGLTLRLGRGAAVSYPLAAREPGDARHDVIFKISSNDHSVDDGQGLNVALWQGRGTALTVHEVEIVQTLERPDAPPVLAAPSVVSRVTARIVIVGNCQAEVLAYGLRTMLGSASSLVHYHFVGHQAKLHDNARRELLDCDLLFAQDISDFATYPFRSEIPDHVAVRRFPMLRLSTPWPFDSHNGLRDTHAELREAVDPMFHSLDGVLARLRREISRP